MDSTGRIVTIKRSGADGPHFPLSLSSCLFGRAIECDIRIQLPVVSKQHCKIETNKQEVMLINYSSTNPTLVNGSAIEGAVPLRHGDVITIVDRSFRYENKSPQDGGRPGPPGQQREQESMRRASRSGCSSESGGSIAEPGPHAGLTEGRVSEGRVSRRSLAAGSAPEGPDPPGPAAATPAGAEAGAPLGSCGAGSGSGSASPFRRLYESMRGQLDAKPEKGNILQDSRRSGAQGPCLDAPGSSCGLQAGVPAPASLKLRRTSGRSSQVKADPAWEGGSSRAGEQEAEEGPGQHPGAPTSPAGPRAGAPATPQSQQNSSRKRRREDPGGLAAGAAARPGGSPGLGPDEEAPVPRKLFARSQTPTEAGSAQRPGAAQDKLPGRRSSPARVAVLRMDTGAQSPAILAPLPVQLERRGQKDPPHQPRTPGLSPAGHSSFAESLSKTEGVALKRRRVSFGGRLEPELFDENLPPNTPLKRGETPTRRKSLAPPTPAVLKKIIKEQPGAPVREAAPETHSEPASPAARSPGGAALATGRSVTVAATPAAGRSPHASDAPRRGGRRSSGLSQRVSLGRSRQGALHLICSRRRSGASEANLLVARSWADVVKLGAKQTQVRAAKPAPQRQLHRRPRKARALEAGAHTPGKPAAGATHLSQFSTGHANSPCTITVGRAQLEKARAPARPLRVLSHLAFGRRADFSEDLSGLTEMFKTPAKEKPQAAHTGPAAEDPPGERPSAPASGAESLLHAAGSFGDGLALSTQDAATGPSDGGSASPAVPGRRRAEARVAGLAQTPGSTCDAAGPQMGGSRQAERPLAAASGTGEAGGSAALRAVCTAAAEPPGAGQGSGRRRRKMPLWEQTLEWEMKAGESAFEACKKTVELEESSDATVAVRSRRASGRTWAGTDVAGLQRPCEADPGPAPASTQSRCQTPGPARGAAVSGARTTQMPCSSPKPELAGTRRRPGTPLGTEGQLPAPRTPLGTPGAPTLAQRVPADDDQEAGPLQEAPAQKLPSAGDASGGKRRARTPRTKAPALEEDLAGLSELFRTPGPAQEAVPGDRAKILCETPRAEPVGTPVSRRRLSKTPLGKAGLGGARPAPSTPRGTPGPSARSLPGPAGAAEGASSIQEAPRQMPDPAADVTGSKRAPSTPRPKAEPLEDLGGFPELFRTPVPTQDLMIHDTATRIPCRSPKPEPVGTPRRLRTPLGRVDQRPAPSTPRGMARSLPGPAGAAEGALLIQEAPQQVPDPAADITGSKRAPRTPRPKAEPLEDLGGFPELFRTPDGARGPASADRAPQTPRTAAQAEPVSAPARRTRRLGTTPQRAEDLGEPTGTAGPEQTPVGSAVGRKRAPSTPRAKAQPLEDLAGFSELFRTPDQAQEPEAGDRAPQVARTPAEPEAIMPSSRSRRLRELLGSVHVEAERPAPRKSTRTVRKTTGGRQEPTGEEKGVNLSKETAERKLDDAGTLTGGKRQPRAARGKARPSEDLAGSAELSQHPRRARGAGAAAGTTSAPRTAPHTAPPPEPAATTAQSRRPRAPPGGVAEEEEHPAPGSPTRTALVTTRSRREPGAGDGGRVLLQEPAGLGPGTQVAVPGSRQPLRASRRRARALGPPADAPELCQGPGHAQAPVTDAKASQTPCESPEPERVLLPSKQTRARAPPAGRQEEAGPSAPRKSSRTAASRPAGTGVCPAPARDAPPQEEARAGGPAGSRRQPRASRAKTQPLVATGQQGLQGLGRVGEDASRSPPRVPDVRAPRRALRAPRQPPGGELAGSGDPVSSQSGEQAPQEDCRAAGRRAAKRLHPGKPPLGAAGEKPDPKKRRTVPGAAVEPPQPPTAKKSQRLAGRRPVPVQGPPGSAEAQAAGPRGGDAAATGRSLRTRRPDTAGAGEPGPGRPVSADAVAPESGGEKAPRTSRETAPRRAEGEAAVLASPRSLRSGRRDKKAPPAAAEERTGEAPGEKAAADGPTCRSLRSRRQTGLPAGAAEQRATRGTERGPTEATEDDKNVSAWKLRTRSRRDHKDT